MFMINRVCLFTNILRVKLLAQKTSNFIHSSSIFSLNSMKSKNNAYISNKITANKTVMIRRFSSSNQENTATNTAVNPSNGENKSKPKPDLTAIFELDDGTQLIGKACHGDNLLDVVLNNELPIEGFGACEGTLACSTCHVILSQEDFDRLSNPITDEEMDMLDLAFGLTDTSRLGCRVYMTKDFDGIKVKVPAGVNDIRLR